MTNRSKTQFNIAYSCGHRALYAKPVPDTGDVVICLQCREYVDVVDETPITGFEYDAEFDCVTHHTDKRGELKTTCQECFAHFTGNANKVREWKHTHMMRKHPDKGVRDVQLTLWEIA